MDCCSGLRFILLLGCWISGTPMVTLGGVVLMPNTSLNCPGPIQFTCLGTDVPNTLIWRVNGTDHRGEYAFLPSHTFPRSIPLNPSLPGVEVLIINASISNQVLINVASTLTSTTTLLVGATIQCIVGFNTSSTVYRIDFIIAPPTRPLLECSLVISPGDIIVSMDSFSSGNNVTNYNVVASPTPSSCPSERQGPGEDYSCSGLILGTRYSFNVSAINCENQEGAENTIIVHPQVPLIPEIVVFPTYNDESSLSQLTVTWQVKRLSISNVCSFDNSLNYSIFLNDSRGGRLEERVVNSGSCNNNLCSTSFNTSSSSNQSYLVSIYAVNAFGRSDTAESTSIGNSLQSEVLLTFEDCVTTLLCSSVLAEGPCFVQYGQNSSYENFDNHLNVSLNSPSPLPLMDALTQYYFQVEVRVNSTISISRRSFMTGEFPVRLTDANIGLLIIGILFLILSILVCMPLFQKYESLVLLLVAVFLWLVSVCLWIAVGGVVGPQKNTCDLKWQSNRDNIIIAAFVLSFISLLLFITATAVAIYKIKKVDFYIKEMDQKFGHAKPSQEPASKCQQCGSEFSIIKWNRPHYCGACGKCFCALCTVNEANLPYDLKTKQKVCDSCYVKCKEKGIQVYGPGPSRFYQPTSLQPVTQQTGSSQTVTSTENGSTTKSLTKEGTPDRYVNITSEEDSQNQKVDGSGGKPTEQEAPHDQSNLPNDSAIKPDEQPQQKDKIGAVKPIKSTGTSACEICKKEYSYIQFNTAHYCEACGKCVCSLCSLNKAYLPYDKEELKRVCNICYEECKKQGIEVYAVSNDSESDKVCEKCKTHFQCSENNMMLCPRCHKESEKKGDLHVESKEETTV